MHSSKDFDIIIINGVSLEHTKVHDGSKVMFTVKVCVCVCVCVCVWGGGGITHTRGAMTCRITYDDTCNGGGVNDSSSINCLSKLILAYG